MPYKSLDYLQVLNAITAAVVILDAQQKVVFANATASALLGLDSSSDLKQELESKLVLQPQDKIHWVTTCKQGLSAKFSGYLKSSDFELTPIQLTLKPLHSTEQMLVEIEELSPSILSWDETRNLGLKMGQIAHDMSSPLAILRMNYDSLKLKSQSTETFSKEEVLKRVETLSLATERLCNQNQTLKHVAKSLINLEEEAIKQICSTPEDELR